MAMDSTTNLKTIVTAVAINQARRDHGAVWEDLLDLALGRYEVPGRLFTTRLVSIHMSNGSAYDIQFIVHRVRKMCMQNLSICVW
jgi:hypothetical protein